jgi:hypothetical protein
MIISTLPFHLKKNGYTYLVIVATSKDFLEKMDQEKINFVEPGPPMILLKKLTKGIFAQAIEAYAKMVKSLPMLLIFLYLTKIVLTP